MTIVAAAIGDDGIWIGSDGRACNGDLITSEDCRKWSFSPCGKWALSHSGDLANREAVEEVFAQPTFAWPKTYDLAGVRRLLAGVREGMEALPCGVRLLRKEGDNAPSWQWAPIIASPLGVWRPDSTLWAVLDPIRGAYIAGGSGQDFALGAMSALYDAGCRSARQLVTSAIATACRLTPACGGRAFLRCFAPSPPVSSAAETELACVGANGSERLCAEMEAT